jgi:hypothetical protein
VIRPLRSLPAFSTGYTNGDPQSWGAGSTFLLGRARFGLAVFEGDTVRLFFAGRPRGAAAFAPFFAGARRTLVGRSIDGGAAKGCTAGVLIAAVAARVAQ